MHCPTPELELPKNFRRTKRETAKGALKRSKRVSKQTEKSLKEKQTRAKEKRAIVDASPKPNATLNNRNLQFYLGFKLDGVQAYRNLTKTKIPGGGILNVYEDPHVHHFPENKNLRLYQPFWPYQHKVVRITVN